MAPPPTDRAGSQGRDRAERPGSAAAPAGPPAVGPPDAVEVDLLAVLAADELSAFLRLSALAPTGPTLADVRGLSAIAVDHLARHERVAGHLERLGVDVGSVVDPWRASLEVFHRRLAPSTWGEVVVGAYVGDAVTSDVCAALAAGAGADTAALVLEVLGPPPAAPPGTPAPSGAPAAREQDGDGSGEGAGSGLHAAVAAFAVPALRRAVAADPLLPGRLSLWGRRLMGEALGQAQAVLAARPGLQELLAGAGRGAPVVRAPVADTFARVTQAHVGRMVRLGLTP